MKETKSLTKGKGHVKTQDSDYLVAVCGEALMSKKTEIVYLHQFQPKTINHLAISCLELPDFNQNKGRNR